MQELPCLCSWPDAVILSESCLSSCAGQVLHAKRYMKVLGHESQRLAFNIITCSNNTAKIFKRHCSLLPTIHPHIYIKRIPYILLESHPSGSAGPRNSRSYVKYTPTRLTECGKAIPLQHCKHIHVYWSRVLQCDAAQARIETLIMRSCPETTMCCRKEKFRRRVHDKVRTRN